MGMFEGGVFTITCSTYPCPWKPAQGGKRGIIIRAQEGRGGPVKWRVTGYGETA